MLKEHEPPKEPARIKAERRWTNSDVRKRLKEERARPKLVDPNKEPEIAETITNDGSLKGPVRNLERKFLKDIRALMNEPRERILAQYMQSLERRRYLLLKEKLRRLKLAQQESELKEGSNV